MLNSEELLIMIMQLLDIDMKEVKLKQTVEKKRFITQEESNQKYKEHIELFFSSLDLDSKNIELKEIFEELLFYYSSIYELLITYQTATNQKKLNWIILKRLVVPFLAYKFANLDVDYDSRIDKNMPGGVFWYLPNVVEDKRIVLPIEFLMNWWLDLYGKKLDSLCNEIDDNSHEKQAFSSKDILKQWKYKGVVPNSQSLRLYLAKNLTYNGIFNFQGIGVAPKYREALRFVKEIKKLTLEKLKDELPYSSLLEKVYSSEKLNVAEKKQFITFVEERWNKPSQKNLLSKFLVARVVQDTYKRLLNYFEFKDSSDIEENKIWQLVKEYYILYNIQMDIIQKKLKTHPLHYEMIEPFYAPSHVIINTIAGDISIELTNPNSEESILEDNYMLKAMIFLEEKDNRCVQAFKDKELFNQYFHKKFDEIDIETKHYFSLSKKEFDIKLSNEKNFSLLSNLFIIFFNQNSDYEKSKKVCIQMKNIEKTKKDKIKVSNVFITLYTSVTHENNQNNYDEVKSLLDNSDPEDKEYMVDGLLLTKANFYLKSKQFSKSLELYNEIFDTSVKDKKKENISDFIVYLAGCSAYIAKDKKKLKKFNNYLKKRNIPIVESIKSLPFSIYFYN